VIDDQQVSEAAQQSANTTRPARPPATSCPAGERMNKPSTRGHHLNVGTEAVREFTPDGSRSPA